MSVLSSATKFQPIQLHLHCLSPLPFWKIRWEAGHLCPGAWAFKLQSRFPPSLIHEIFAEHLVQALGCAFIELPHWRLRQSPSYRVYVMHQTGGIQGTTGGQEGPNSAWRPAKTSWRRGSQAKTLSFSKNSPSMTPTAMSPVRYICPPPGYWGAGGILYFDLGGCHTDA